MRKLVIAPDSFKESLSAQEASDAIARGFQKVFPDLLCKSVPMADGGEGTMQALVDATAGRKLAVTVTGPLGEPVKAELGILGDGTTAVVEMAQAAGLELVPPEQRNPLLTTTYGVGELIREALDLGCTRCLICLGGSATVDGGTGMAMALGAKLMDSAGHSIPMGGQGLDMLASIEKPPFANRCEFTGLCDVENPLTGPNGAAAVYGPQKGASSAEVERLERGLNRLAQLVGPEVADLPGSGAAGGLGAALVAFLNAPLRPGIQVIAEAVDLTDALNGADLVVTGEGGINSQTALGKTPCGVAKYAKERGIPVIAIAGKLGNGFEAIFGSGIDAAFSMSPGPGSLEESLAHASAYLEQCSEQIARTLKIGSSL